MGAFLFSSPNKPTVWPESGIRAHAFHGAADRRIFRDPVLAAEDRCD
jgi:hypothetical protein